MEVHDNIALDPGIGGVEIDAVITAAEEDVVDKSADGARKLSTGEIDDVVVAGGCAEDVAFKEGVAVIRKTPEVDEFASCEEQKLQFRARIDESLKSRCMSLERSKETFSKSTFA